MCAEKCLLDLECRGIRVRHEWDRSQTGDEKMETTS